MTPTPSPAALQVDETMARASIQSVEAFFDGSEQEAMDLLIKSYGIILRGWGLQVNHSELNAAVHVIQGFITQHALCRQRPDFTNWWDPALKKAEP